MSQTTKSRDSSSAVRLIDPRSEPDWDVSLASLPGATFFHGQAWTHVLHDTYGFKPVFIANGCTGHLDSLLPLMEVDSWLTGRRGVGLPFTDECALLSPRTTDSAPLIAAALAQAKIRAWKYLECRGGRPCFGPAPCSTAFYGHQLDLRDGESQLFSRTNPAVRRAVRKAEHNSLTITVSQEIEAVRIFYALHCQTRKRHGLPAQPFRFFANIQRYILEKNQGHIVLARQGATPIAGAVFFHFGNTAIFKFGASDSRYQHLRANNLVMWESIKWHARRGFFLLDFGRTSLTNAGLRKFKLGWGTTERKVEYVRYELRSHSFVSVKDESSGWYNRVFHHLPISISRLAGALLYKHAA